jgi:secondary thiamine-phosphate synthase enzyme
MHTLSVSSNHTTELLDITRHVQAFAEKLGAQSGVLYLFCPHTTAGLTLNENWDPDVKRDLLLTMDGHIAPPDARHQHGEGNSPAHIKTTLVGSNTLVFVEDGKLQLGQWQGIYLAEFDGPRSRKIWLKFLGG